MITGLRLNSVPSAPVTAKPLHRQALRGNGVTGSPAPPGCQEEQADPPSSRKRREECPGGSSQLAAAVQSRLADAGVETDRGENDPAYPVLPRWSHGEYRAVSEDITGGVNDSERHRCKTVPP